MLKSAASCGGAQERRSIMKSRITAALAGAYIASVLSIAAAASPAADNVADGAGDVVENIGEGAGDVIENVGEGAAEIADGIGDAANDVLDGAGDAVGDITGADDPDDTVVNDDDIPDSIAEITDDDDVDDTEEDTDDDDTIYEAEIYTRPQNNDRNPATGGSPSVTAGLVAVAAAGVAYLTKKRGIESRQEL